MSFARSLERGAVLFVAALLCAAPVPATAQARRAAAPPPERAAAADVSKTYESAIAGLRWREIGPAVMGGRIDDFAVVESDPSTVFAGTASGGLWKTTNAGTTWTPIFDNQEVSTIGDVALAPSDPSIVWVGTGESNNRQSSSWGNGVYKSTDGGTTWKHMGLRETHHIARVVVHPSNPDVVYVAATGRLWGPSKERGVYKTTDGGLSWKAVLQVNEDTGATDVVMDPQSPDTLYAAMYQRRRTVFGFAGSGPDGGIFKTTDGGASWKKLEKGLPWDSTPEPAAPRAPGRFGGGGGASAAAAQTGQAAETAREKAPREEIGRIGLAVYRRDPRIVYALVEHQEGGIFRSEDRGETWRKMSDTNPRPMYYSQIHIDPNNDQRLWVHGANMFYSEDGGKTFDSNLVQRIHGDHHAMWINPADSNHLIVGSDGGIHWSHDRGRTWEFVNNLAIGQFYEIGVDMRQPYYICGGLQDNNAWCGPSMSFNPRGIDNDDWFTIGGGDGFYAQMDPTDSNTVYTESQDGNVLRRDLRTGESKSIRPVPAEGEPQYRFQWNSPIVISKSDNKVIYYGGNFLFRSTDRGDSWTKISPDLTTGADRNTMPILGRVPDKWTRSRHDGVQNWPASTGIAESPVNKDVLWVGTDDGNLQVTRDGGKTWKNVAERVTGVPKGTYVSRVIASAHAEGTAYATFDGHRSDDFGIYVYATTDFGETWKKITDGLPNNNGIINVIREHPKNPDLLFAGGEYGAFVSFTRGAKWVPLKMNLPTVPVDDILVHPRDNDLIFGTHGRSIWILDDITPLVQLNEQTLAKDLHVFDVRPAIQWRMWSNTQSTGHKMFLGDNPPIGAIISYYLKTALPEGQQARIVIQDASGATVRSLTGPASAGINRVTWDTRGESPIPPGQGGPGGGGGGFFGGGGAGPRVDPGEFTVKVTAGALEATQKLEVREDPRVTMTAADRAARRDAIGKLLPLAGPITSAQRTVTTLRSTLASQTETWRRPGGTRVPENVQKAAAALLAKVDEIYPNFGTPPSEERGLGDAGPPLVDRGPTVPMRVLQLYGQIANTSLPPTAWQLEQIPILAVKVTDLSTRVRALVDQDLAALNKLMNEAGVPHIALPAGPGGRRPPQ